MKSIALDRLKDAAIYALALTVLTVFVTAAFWWHVPSKVVICTAILADVTLTFAVYAALYTIERVLINSMKIKKPAHGEHISRVIVCAVARDGR